MSDAHFLKICAVVLLCVAVGAVIKLLKQELSFAVKVAGVLLVFGFILVSMQELLATLQNALDTGGFSEYVEIVLKALGVALLTHVSSSICRDFGEGNLAGMVEFAGKVEILLLSLPMIERLLRYTSEIASLGA